MTLSGSLGQVSGVQALIQQISSFSFDTTGLSSQSKSDFDKQFVEDSLTSNSLELSTMDYAYPRVKDAQLKSLIGMMIMMHSKDQQTLLQIAPQFGVDTTSVDFTNASVFPETPDYDLGVRTENLARDYLDHLVEKSKVSFDEQVVSVIKDEHVTDVQDELAAERVVTSEAVRAFAKHSADVTELHIKLLDMVSQRISEQFDEQNQPDVSAGYMSPMQITIAGQSSACFMSNGSSSNGSSNQGSTSNGSSSKGSSNSGSSSKGSSSSGSSNSGSTSASCQSPSSSSGSSSSSSSGSGK